MTGNITYVKQKSGVVYAYENLATWDKVNKKPICRRRLIGKLDPETKQIVPTDQRNRSQSPDYKPEPYEIGYVMPRTLAQRKKEILRLLKENYQLRRKLAKLQGKDADNMAASVSDTDTPESATAAQEQGASQESGGTAQGDSADSTAEGKTGE
jgi:hypothetical protein